MKAQAGDRIQVRSRSVGAPPRSGVVVATQEGNPPFEVRWDGSEVTALVFPGPDAAILPAGESSVRAL